MPFGAKVAISKVPHAGVDEAALGEPFVDAARDDVEIGVPAAEVVDPPRGADQIEENNPVLLDAILQKVLYRLPWVAHTRYAG